MKVKVKGIIIIIIITIMIIENSNLSCRTYPAMKRKVLSIPGCKYRSQPRYYDTTMRTVFPLPVPELREIQSQNPLLFYSHTGIIPLATDRYDDPNKI